MPDRKRILYIFGALHGGSESFAQYAQAASRMGYEVFACSQANPETKTQGLRNIAVTQCPPGRMHRPDEVWRAFDWYRRYCVAHPGIALIHVNCIAYYPLARALGRTFGVPVIYTYVDTTLWGGRFLEGLETGQYFTTLCREFKQRLTGAGVDPDSISECACRFDFSALPVRGRTQTRRVGEPVSCAIVGRMDSEKLDSIRTALMVIEWMLARGISTRAHFYGDGSRSDEVRRLCAGLTNEDGSPVAVFHGYVKDAALAMQDHDLVFGKARCIVEALAQGIGAVVIGESGKWRIVRQNNWRDLAEANFSGRGLTMSSTFEELEAWLRDSRESSNEAEALSRMIRESFDSKNIDPWLGPIYERALTTRVSRQPLRAPFNLIFLSIRTAASFLWNEKVSKMVYGGWTMR